ncbi:MAG: hypothetical protein ACOCXQ_00590 [Patescibacteria group bacterium]
MEETLSYALQLVGLIIGLGAVTVIDMHGFIAWVRRSPYWTEATIRTHKITKPLIWVGTTLLAASLMVQAGSGVYLPYVLWKAVLLAVLVLNGLYLSFVVSPILLQREREGKAGDLLPSDLQRKIVGSFIVSDLGWWGYVVLVVIGS